MSASLMKWTFWPYQPVHFTYTTEAPCTSWALTKQVAYGNQSEKTTDRDRGLTVASQHVVSQLLLWQSLWRFDHGVWMLQPSEDMLWCSTWMIQSVSEFTFHWLMNTLEQVCSESDTYRRSAHIVFFSYITLASASALNLLKLSTYGPHWGGRGLTF